MKRRPPYSWRQAEPYRDDTALTARELIPSVIVWFLCLITFIVVLPLLFQPVGP